MVSSSLVADDFFFLDDKQLKLLVARNFVFDFDVSLNRVLPQFDIAVPFLVMLLKLRPVSDIVEFITFLERRLG